MDLKDIAKSYMFASLNDEELLEIEKISKVKIYNKSESIFFDTEPYSGFYIVLKGLVKIFKISKDGKEHILHLINPGNSFAEVPLFENSEKILSDEAKYPANASATEDYTQVLFIPSRPFLEFVESNNKLLLKIISGFAKRMRTLTLHIEDIALKDVVKRVAGYILSEYKIQQSGSSVNPSIELNISKNDLASYIGTIPETLSRTFKKLQEDDLVVVNGSVIQITDLKKLQKLSL